MAVPFAETLLFFSSRDTGLHLLPSSSPRFSYTILRHGLTVESTVDGLIRSADGALSTSLIHIFPLSQNRFEAEPE